ncbi:response regulator [Haloterrigena salinisoli]|uniref:response regulator n=1 Tax=Haloterrigena salinisoli TaxID=3132747 RepID=UPI0030CBB919
MSPGADRDTDVNSHSTILLVEDNPGDARLVKEVSEDLGLADLLSIVTTGSDALDFVNQRGEYTDAPSTNLIILDWHLPDMAGEVVLEEMNSDPAHNHIPVIVTTGSVPKQEVRKIYKQNANGCLMKPGDPEELKKIIQAFETFWLSVARLPRADTEEQ